MQHQRQAAEDGDDRKTGPEHAVDLATTEPYPADLREGRGNGDAGGDKDAEKLESGKKQDDGKQVEQEFHRVGLTAEWLADYGGKARECPIRALLYSATNLRSMELPNASR